MSAGLSQSAMLTPNRRIRLLSYLPENMMHSGHKLIRKYVSKGMVLFLHMIIVYIHDRIHTGLHMVLRYIQTYCNTGTIVNTIRHTYLKYRHYMNLCEVFYRSDILGW